MASLALVKDSGCDSRLAQNRREPWCSIRVQ